MTIVINSDDVEQLHWCLLQVGVKPSRWPQVLVTLAYAEKVAHLGDGDGDGDGLMIMLVLQINLFHDGDDSNEIHGDPLAYAFVFFYHF